MSEATMTEWEPAERVREVGRWIERHADDIVGEGNGKGVRAGGLTVRFTLNTGRLCPDVEVRRLHTTEPEAREARGAGVHA